MQATPISRKPPDWKPCTQESERCQYWTWEKDYLRPECCTDHLKELLFFVEELLTRHGVFHWLDLGTLLGAVREQELIPWDTDIDIGVLKRDEAKIDALKEEVNDAGYYFLRDDPRFRWRIHYSRTNLQGVDLSRWWEKGGLLRRKFPFRRIPGWRFPPRYLENLEPVVLYGKEFPAPSPAHDFLAQHRYGPGYMIPQRETWNHAITPDVDVGELNPLTQSLLNEIRERDYHIQQLEDRTDQIEKLDEESTDTEKPHGEKIWIRMLGWYYSGSVLARGVQKTYRWSYWKSKQVRWGIIGYLALLDHKLNLGTMKPVGETLQRLPEIGSDEFSPLVGQLLYTLQEREARIRQLETRLQDVTNQGKPVEARREFNGDQDGSK